MCPNNMPPVERRQGMSKNHGPRASLLSTFRTPDSPSTLSPDRFKGLKQKKMKDEPDIDAPPLSTDDEGETSEDELNQPDLPTRSQIQPTKFQSLSCRKGPAQSAKEAAKPVAPRGTKSETTTISAGSKRSAEDRSWEKVNPHTDDIGFASTTNTRFSGHRPLGTKKTKNTYGAAAKKPKAQKIRVPQSQPRRNRDRSLSSSSTETAKFNTHGTLGTLDLEISGSPTKKFHVPEALSPSPERKCQNTTFKRLGDGFDEDFESDEGRAPKKGKATQSKVKSSIKTRVSPEQEAPKAKFMIPGELDLADLDDLDNVGQERESTGVSDEAVEKHDGDEMSATKQEEDFSKVQEAKCPMCHEPVDPSLLKKNLVDGRMNVRKQMAFCKLHKQRKAVSSGTEKGYPKIDWEGLNERLVQHMPLLREILEGTQPSEYATTLKNKVESGKDRTLLKIQDTLTPGYYGPRGLRVMTDYIMKFLSSIIRKRAVEDRLISARGYTGYVQAVLVPELAVRLVMEDMAINEAEAKKVLKDSVEVGELLQEDSGDVIVDVSDDET